MESVRLETPSGKSSRVRRMILSQNVRGKYAKNDKIPSETVLTSEFGTFRHTVREALGSLSHEGVLLRRQGAGTYVRGVGHDTRLGRLSEMDVVRLGIAVPKPLAN